MKAVIMARSLRVAYIHVGLLVLHRLHATRSIVMIMKGMLVVPDNTCTWLYLITIITFQKTQINICMVA